MKVAQISEGARRQRKREREAWPDSRDCVTRPCYEYTAAPAPEPAATTRIPEPELPGRALPTFLTHRNQGIKDECCCFELLSYWVIDYAAEDKRNNSY